MPEVESTREPSMGSFFDIARVNRGIIALPLHKRELARDLVCGLYEDIMVEIERAKKGLAPRHIAIAEFFLEPESLVLIAQMESLAVEVGYNPNAHKLMFLAFYDWLN